MSSGYKSWSNINDCWGAITMPRSRRGLNIPKNFWTVSIQIHSIKVYSTLVIFRLISYVNFPACYLTGWRGVVLEIIMLKRGCESCDRSRRKTLKVTDWGKNFQLSSKYFKDSVVMKTFLVFEMSLRNTGCERFQLPALSVCQDEAAPLFTIIWLQCP